MTKQDFQSIRVERAGSVCSIVLNKPPLNIIDFAMIQEIRTALEQLSEDANCRVIVFQGAGDKGFSAGVSVQDHAPDRVEEVVPAFNDLFRLLARTDKVTVGAVHGVCLGGGLELILMCDLVVAAENARFGQPEIKLGQMAPIGIILLPHLVGYRKAAELLLTGATIGASEAQSLGLVNRVVPPEQLAQSVEGLLNELHALSGAVLRLNKLALRRTSALDFEKALEESENIFFGSILKTRDAKEGIFAFLEKRAPRWANS